MQVRSLGWALINNCVLTWGRMGEARQGWGQAGAMQPRASTVRSHRKLEEARKESPKKPQRERGPDDTSISDVSPLQL